MAYHDFSPKKTPPSFELTSSQQDKNCGLKFHGLMDSIAMPVAIMNMEGLISVCNAAYSELLGYSFEVLKQRSIQSLVHSDDFEQSLKMLKALSLEREISTSTNDRHIT